MKKFLQLFSVLLMCTTVANMNAFASGAGRCDWVPPEWVAGTKGAHTLLYATTAVPATIVGAGLFMAGSTTAVASSIVPIFGVPGVVSGNFIAKIGKNALSDVKAFMKESNDDFICFGGGLDKCLQCDIHQAGDAFECGNGVVVASAAGAVRCYTGNSDHWAKYNIPTCSNSPLKMTAGGDKNVDIKSSSSKSLDGVMIYGSDACFYVTCASGWHQDGGNCVQDVQYCESNINGRQYKVAVGGSETVDYQTCKVINSSADKNGEKFSLKCGSDKKFTCSLLECKDKYTADGEKCKLNWTTEDCIKSRSTPEGRACCKLGNQTYSFINATNTCPCKKGVFKMIDVANEIGACVEGGNEPGGDPQKPVAPQCDTATGARLNAATNTCVCGVAEMHLNADGLSCSCDDTNKEFKNGKCQYTEEYMLVIKRKEISEIRARLDKIMSGLKVSVWKDEEGNFNTARLASDSIAGVVLGTVGGVVTSKVVKKNQLKKGFEAVQCSIGGQSVADYGDEFVVGLGGM